MSDTRSGEDVLINDLKAKIENIKQWLEYERQDIEARITGVSLISDELDYKFPSAQMVAEIVKMDEQATNYKEHRFRT